MQTQIDNAAIPAMAQMPPTEFIVPTNEERAAPRFVFFAGDVITPTNKYSDPTQSFGGISLNTFQTLAKTNYMVYRCRITELRPAMRQENPKMIAPANRPNYQNGYVEKNGGAFNPQTGIYEDLVVHNSVTGLIYDKVYPADEIAQITRRSNGYEAGGIVELTSLAGQTSGRAEMVQMHYFPDWEAIQAGEKNLPRTIPELRAHLQKRLSAASSENLKNTGREMIRSCDEFTEWGTRYVKAFTDQIERSKALADAPVGANVYNELCEMLFEILVITRKDAMLNEIHVNQVRQAQMGNGSSMSEEELELKRRELALREEEVRLRRLELEGKTSADAAPPEKTLCAGTNAKGEPCKAFAVKDGEFCAAHQSKTEEVE